MKWRVKTKQRLDEKEKLFFCGFASCEHEDMGRLSHDACDTSMCWLRKVATSSSIRSDILTLTLKLSQWKMWKNCIFTSQNKKWFVLGALRSTRGQFRVFTVHCNSFLLVNCFWFLNIEILACLSTKLDLHFLLSAHFCWPCMRINTIRVK